MNTRYDRNSRMRARRTIVAMCCTAMIGCQSFQPAGGTVPGLQEEIRSGTLVTVGERIRVTTIDGKRHEFEVKAIDDESISGKQYQVEIDEIQRVEHAQVSVGRTALLVGGVLAVLVALVASSSMNDINFSSGSSGQ